MLTGNNWLFVRQVDSDYDVIFLEHYRLDVLLLGSLTFSFSLATTNFIENYKMIDGVSESLLNHFHASWGGRGGGRGGGVKKGAPISRLSWQIFTYNRGCCSCHKTSSWSCNSSSPRWVDLPQVLARSFWKSYSYQSLEKCIRWIWYPDWCTNWMMMGILRCLHILGIWELELKILHEC